MSAIRPEIQSQLRRLRRWVRRYVLLEGLAILLVAACGLFWITFGIDWAYFKMSQLELPGWFRVAAAIVMATGLAGIALAWVLGRTLKPMPPRDLALALERMFPELNDRLITSVELSQRDGSDLQQAMLARTSDEAAGRLGQLPIEQVLDGRQLRRMGIAAGMLAMSVLALGIANAQGMERWYNAYILGREGYWEPFRRNALQLHIIAQPGDRVREFDEQGTYRHPRGADLHLVGIVPDGMVPPDQADVSFLALGAGGRQRGKIGMSRVSEHEFQQTLSRVTEDHLLWIHAGDYTNREPLRIQVVDPPRVEEMRLACDYPDYANMEALQEAPLIVAGTQVLLPMETAFVLRGRVNKPLRRVHLRSDSLDLSFGFDGAGDELHALPTRLTLTPADSEQSATIALDLPPDKLLAADRLSFEIPFQVSTSAAKLLAELGKPATEREVKVSSIGPILLPPDDTLRITLEDEDEIYSQQPANLTVLGIVDQPPVVDTRRIGVGPVVTRIARIPVEGRITDDYGVQDAWFGYRVNDAAEDSRQEFARKPAGQKEFPLRQAEQQPVETLNLIPLNLQEGQTLLLAVHARDGDNLNGPHLGHGELMSFTIVSREELLDRIFGRELNLRSRFEQTKSEVEELKTSVEEIQEQVKKLAAGAVEENLTPQVVSAYVDRALHQIRKNHTESRSIEVSFRDLREELVNNRIDTAEMLERIDLRIIEPLGILNGSLFQEVDQRLGAFRLAVERNRDMQASGERVLPALQAVIDQMDRIIAEMKSRGTSAELIQELMRLVEEQKKIREETENKRIEDQFFAPL